MVTFRDEATGWGVFIVADQFHSWFDHRAPPSSRDTPVERRMARWSSLFDGELKQRASPGIPLRPTASLHPRAGHVLPPLDIGNLHH
jgi:hypothetical protein